MNLKYLHKIIDKTVRHLGHLDEVLRLLDLELLKTERTGRDI